VEVSVIASRIRSARDRLDRLELLAAEQSLVTDPSVLAAARRTLDVVENLISGTGVGGHAAELRVRAGLQLAAAAALALDWRSPAAAQAGVLAVGDVAALEPDMVNYARFLQPGLAALEDHLADQLAVAATRTVLACGSGQAALSVLLASLVGTGRLVRPLVTSTVYLEARETIHLFSGGRTIVREETDPHAIVEAAIESGADVVFADPLGNGPRPRLCDVEVLAHAMAESLPEALLVVDATMLPCAGLYTRLALSPHVLMYESSGKYRHCGLDLALGGLMCVPADWARQAREARRQTGAVPDRYTVELWPRVGPHLLADRFQQMQAAAGTVAHSLSHRELAGWSVGHPSLADHPDHDVAERLRWFGTCVTLTPSPTGTQQTAAMCAAALEHARDVGAPMVVGESFGFSVSRLSFTPMGVSEPPFVRLSVGTADADEVELLSDCLLVGCTAHG
jgi:cystathionine beta-lyase/cystathionine gamma-synthase